MDPESILPADNLRSCLQDRKIVNNFPFWDLKKTGSAFTVPDRSKEIFIYYIEKE